MVDIKLAPGFIWVRWKETGHCSPLYERDFDPKECERVDGPSPVGEQKSPPPEASQPKPSAQKDLAEMSASELRALPEFKSFPSNKIFRNKEELIQAILEVRSKE